MLQIGSNPILADLITAPLGTEVEDSYDRKWTKHMDGWHFRESVFGPDAMCHSWSVVVKSIGTTPSTETSFQSYAQRFATIGRGRAHMSGVAIHPVTRLLTTLGVGGIDYRVGMWHHPYDRDLVMPSGTVGAMGDALYVSIGGTWRPINGTAENIANPNQRCVQVMSFPDGVAHLAWDPIESPEAEAKKIDDLRRQAWDLGVRAKSTNNWCGDFENAMDRCHISARILALLDEPTASHLQSDCPIPIGVESKGQVTRVLMEQAPIGTRVQQDRHDGTSMKWTKQDVDLWVRDSDSDGGHTHVPSAQFSTLPLHLTRWGA